MNKNKMLHLVDLVDDIKELDQIIELHVKEDKSSFSISQYQSRKNKLIADFIDQLVTSVSVSEDNFLAIKLALDKFYPNLSNSPLNKVKHDLSALQAALK